MVKTKTVAKPVVKQRNKTKRFRGKYNKSHNATELNEKKH